MVPIVFVHCAKGKFGHVFLLNKFTFTAVPLVCTSFPEFAMCFDD